MEIRPVDPDAVMCGLSPGRPCAGAGGVLALVLCACSLMPARAGIDQLIHNFQQSDFEFGKVESRVPYPPLSWLSYTIYDETEFVAPDAGDPGAFQQQAFSQSLLLPVYIGQRDLFAAGEFVGYNRFDFRDPDRDDRDLYNVGLIGGWIRQVTPRSQLSAFGAPFVSTRFDGTEPEGVEFYTGLVGLYRSTDTFTWLYGGVYEYGFGDHFLYPYAGFIWLPSPDLSVSFVAPWPSVTYALTDRLMLRAGFAPAGSTWSLEDDGEEANLEFGSWNLMAGAEYRLNRLLWLYAGVGTAGFRSFQVSSDGESELDVDVDQDPIVMIALNFRPPGGLAQAPAGR